MYKAKVNWISPIVRCAVDWCRERHFETHETEENPAFVSSKKVCNHYKKHGCSTMVVGASFGNTGEGLAVVGCDLLIISLNIRRNRAERVVHRDFRVTLHKEMTGRFNQGHRWEYALEQCGPLTTQDFKVTRHLDKLHDLHTEYKANMLRWSAQDGTTYRDIKGVSYKEMDELINQGQKWEHALEQYNFFATQNRRN